MNQVTVNITEGQYLAQVEPFKSLGLPTNSIIHKIVTGCGATSLEIEYTDRNSIIIVPNVPVIKGKVTKHNKKYGADKQILGIYRGVTEDHIESYLASKAIHKKIITTPEGFVKKIIPYFEHQLDELYNNYFLLFDECERIITDVSYRGNIAAPIQYFFKFKNKALVSATTLPYSHEGFKDFDHYLIEPSYDFSKDITVIDTNNVMETLRVHLKGYESEPVFIFANSTDLIFNIMDQLDIKRESKVFCADQSVAKLATLKFRAATSEFDKDSLAKYNFLTSRYFSAFDIDLEYKPNVFMVSDVYTAQHSMIDPQTEAIQIAGRFRNGIADLTHITNFNPDLESMAKEECLNYLQGCFDTYEHVIDLFSKANHRGSRDTLKFFIENSPIASFYTENKLNEFMVDNFIHEEKVKGYYQNIDNLKTSYRERFQHFNPLFISDEYILGDIDRAKLNSKQTVKERKWEAIRLIDRMTKKPGVMKIINQALFNNIKQLYPNLTEAYYLIGLKGLEKTKLNANRVQAAVHQAKKLRDLKIIEPMIHQHFTENTFVLNSDILKTIQQVCLAKAVETKATISLITNFFDCKKTTVNKAHGYRLGSNRLGSKQVIKIDDDLSE
ncbi:hypothetical protein LJ707_16250 [Mucilaginibacter sp. UR6-1]|uniref:hypothetical protein n=1 Tax=Mucilaginibacter sp. UR6-1 TaxID=1435643 RepID=UPI001E2F4EEE|nr:hypothetical protein [Mucilaginibacter sp. UR6-1]MCC8410495.1 hypothetical protein [Mucilaginibacter sp. UR6-1]